MSIKFIDIIQRSSSGFEHRSNMQLTDREPGALFISGVMSHGNTWRPASPRDVDALLDWLNTTEFDFTQNGGC